MNLFLVRSLGCQSRVPMVGTATVKAECRKALDDGIAIRRLLMGSESTLGSTRFGGPPNDFTRGVENAKILTAVFTRVSSPEGRSCLCGPRP